MSGDHKILVGSRKSELALIQTKYVISHLKNIYPEKEFEIVTMTTLGDKILDIPLPKIGEKSLFTRELENALVTRYVNFVVHSLKDLPTSLPEGMAIAAVLSREDPRDALVLQKDLNGYSLDTLPAGSIIGTSSLRRSAQLAKNYPHLKVDSIRGNLNTRLKKLDDLGKYKAIVLAVAGLIRIGWKHRISKILEKDDILYAVGQGALAIECRADDEETIKLLEPLYDLQTALQITAERSFLKTLGGGCSAPVAVYSDTKIETTNSLKLILTGAVWSLDGKEEIKEKDELSTSVSKNLRCATCPYNNNSSGRNLNIEDLEDVNNCSRCTLSPKKEPLSKKQKLDIPDEMLNNDPHESGPIKLPIGVDFMGQCPYLDASMTNVHDMLFVDNSVGNLNSLKCPFRNGATALNFMNDITTSIIDRCTPDDNNKLFCGLVPHKDATLEGMENARKLGERLARSMISKGALNIMSKAQSITHNAVATSINVVN